MVLCSFTFESICGCVWVQTLGAGSGYHENERNLEEYLRFQRQTLWTSEKVKVNNTYVPKRQAHGSHMMDWKYLVHTNIYLQYDWVDCSHRVWGLGVYILECSFMNSMMIAMIKWVTQIISVPWVELGKDSIYPRTQKCDSLITYSIGYPRMMRNEVFVFSWPSQMWPYMTSIHSSQHPHKPREEYSQEL